MAGSPISGGGRDPARSPGHSLNMLVHQHDQVWGSLAGVLLV